MLEHLQESSYQVDHRRRYFNDTFTVFDGFNQELDNRLFITLSYIKIVKESVLCEHFLPTCLLHFPSTCVVVKEDNMELHIIACAYNAIK